MDQWIYQILRPQIRTVCYLLYFNCFQINADNSLKLEFLFSIASKEVLAFLGQLLGKVSSGLNGQIHMVPLKCKVMDGFKNWVLRDSSDVKFRFLAQQYINLAVQF